MSKYTSCLRLLYLVFFLVWMLDLWSQEAEVIKGPKIKVGVHARVIAADSNIVMVYTEGGKGQKVSSYSLPEFEEIEEYPLEEDVSYFVKTDRGAVGVMLLMNWGVPVQLFIRQFVPGKCHAFNWINCYEGTDTSEIFSLGSKAQFRKEGSKNNRNYLSGYQVIWSEKDSTLYTCIVSSNPVSGVSMHLVKMDLNNESLLTQHISLSPDTQEVFLKHFAIQNGHYIVETSYMTKDEVPVTVDDVYVINTHTLDIKHVPVNSYLPENRKIASNLAFVNNSTSGFLAVCILESAEIPQSHYKGLLKIKFDLDRGTVDTFLVDVLPYEYFESSRDQKSRQIYIDKSWSDPDSTSHLVCYSYFIDKVIRNYGKGEMETLMYFRSHELILIDLNPDHSLHHHQMIHRNSTSTSDANKMVYTYQNNNSSIVLFPDMLEYYDGKGERTNQILKLRYSDHSTIGSGRWYNGRWVFSELKIRPVYTFYPAYLHQSDINQFIAFGYYELGISRICLIKIKE